MAGAIKNKTGTVGREWWTFLGETEVFINIYDLLPVSIRPRNVTLQDLVDTG
jgi:hypothetical protein